MLDEVAKDLGSLRKICVMESLYMNQINAIVNAKVTSILADGVMIEKEGKEEKIPCDNVIMAVGSKARKHEALTAICEEQSIPYHVIGDAKQARRALHAIKEAHEVAREL